jgi:hypothetical protein
VLGRVLGLVCALVHNLKSEASLGEGNVYGETVHTVLARVRQAQV